MNTSIESERNNLTGQALTSPGVSSKPFLASFASLRVNTLLYVLIFVGGFLWTLYLAIHSPGVPLDDEVTHYLISRLAWQNPIWLLNQWGRPMNVTIYAIPSLFGMAGRRWFSLFLSCVTIWLATRIARRLGVKRLWLVPLLLWFQPWFNDLAFTSITEIPFMFFLIWGVDLWQQEHESAASLMFGLLPLVRHEGIALTAAWMGYLLIRRRWVPLLVAIVPELVYNGLYFQAFHDWGFGNFLDTQPTTEYGSGSWFHFFPVVYQVGIPASVLSLIGLIPIIRVKKKALIFVPFIFYFIMQTVIYRYGLFASGGYILFLLPMAPAFAVTAALGAEYAVEVLRLDAARSSGRLNFVVRQGLLRLVFGLTMVAAVVAGFQSRPWEIDPRAQAMAEAADWIKAQGLAGQCIITADRMFEYYFLPYPIVHLDGRSLDDLPSCRLVVWDNKYADSWGLTTVLNTPNSGWEEVVGFEGGRGIIYRKK